MLARRYEAATLEQALARVREDLGPEAVVLYTRERRPPRWWRWLQPGHAEVIAMPAVPSGPCEAGPVSWKPAPPIRPSRGRCRRVAFVGPTGAGKTTAVAKLACEFRLRGWDVRVVSADTWRAGSHRQLAESVKAAGVPVHSGSGAAAPADAELVLVDLPGVHPSMADRWSAVREVLAQVRPHEVHLVVSVAYAPAVLRRVQDDLRELGPTRCVLTHLDEVEPAQVRAALLSLALPVSYLTYSPRVPGEVASARSRVGARWLEVSGCSSG
ncbi:MAG: GTPase [Armatimonadota bacterium]|nr:50S ribosome-binding GTPase [Armatimonadota bacterium]MDW8155937.1 GTPase [Armatimonadota bacterium]